MNAQRRFLDHLQSLGLPVESIAGSGDDCEIGFLRGATAEQRSTAMAERAVFAWVETPAEEAARVAHAAVDSITAESVIARAAYRRVAFSAKDEEFRGNPEPVLRQRTHDLIDEWLADGTLAAEVGG